MDHNDFHQTAADSPMKNSGSAHEYSSSEPKLLGYALIPFHGGKLVWDYYDRYGHDIRVDGMAPMLAGVSNSKPDDFYAIIDGTLGDLRLVSVRIRDFKPFCEDVLYERAQNEESDRFWLEEVFGSVEPIPDDIAEDFLGYDVVTSWMQRLPVHPSQLTKYGVAQEFDLFPSIESAIDFRNYSAKLAEGEVFILEVFALRRLSSAPAGKP